MVRGVGQFSRDQLQPDYALRNTTLRRSASSLSLWCIVNITCACPMHKSFHHWWSHHPGRLGKSSKWAQIEPAPWVIQKLLAHCTNQMASPQSGTIPGMWQTLSFDVLRSILPCQCPEHTSSVLKYWESWLASRVSSLRSSGIGICMWPRWPYDNPCRIWLSNLSCQSGLLGWPSCSGMALYL